MKRLILPLLVLASGLCHGQSSPAFSFSTLPEWPSAASGPIRPLPAGYRLLEYVGATGEQYIDTGLNADSTLAVELTIGFHTNSVPNRKLFGAYTSSAYYYLTKMGGYLRIYAGSAQKLYVLVGAETFRTNFAFHTLYADPSSGTYRIDGTSTTVSTPSFDSGYTFWLFGRNGTSPTYVSSNILSSAKFWRSGVLVRDYIPVADTNGVAGLWDRVSGTMAYSATATPLVAGPEVVDLDSVDPLLPSSRNWYRAWLAATNPPAPPVGSIVLDTLVLPVGVYSPIRDQPSALVEAIVAEPSMLKALVQRYRSGLAPTNIPVTVAHSSTNVVGSVSNLWWVEGEGVWARLRVSSVIYGSHASCEIYGLRAQATDAWGTWGDFFLPWQIRAVSLVAKPALATPVAVPLPAEPAAPYPGRIRP